MDLDRVTYWRNVVGKAAAFLCMIFLIAAIDGLWSGFREPETLIRLLPGESARVNGSLKVNLATVQELDYASGSDLIQLTFEAIHSGFWLGGNMWRGLLSASPEIQAGEYTLKVIPKGEDASKPSTVFEVRIYPDRDSYRKSSPSFMRRWLDVSPWYVFGVCFLSTCLAFVLVYYLAHKREVLLAQEGMAEVYLIEQGQAGCVITFGLGTSHGVQSGGEVVVLDRKGNLVGKAKVHQSTETDSTATLTSECNVQTGFIVSTRR